MYTPCKKLQLVCSKLHAMLYTCEGRMKYYQVRYLTMDLYITITDLYIMPGYIPYHSSSFECLYQRLAAVSFSETRRVCLI